MSPRLTPLTVFPVFLFLHLSLLGQSTLVQTTYGPVQGHPRGNVSEFLGIPFASPPTDSLRWRSPQPPPAWDEPLPADSFPPLCPQKRYQQGEDTFEWVGEEDCLYLNVWTPATDEPTLPVMVFIHGGGNQQGGTSLINGGTTIFDGKNLAERGEVVVVTIQYRLGPLGFLVHPGLEAEHPEGLSGNYAVQDQLWALQWIQDNIAAFGGDHERVTIFGESAGAVNVGNLLLTPLGAGLFQRAALQSGIPILGDYNEEREKGISFAAQFSDETDPQAQIAQLRTLSADSLIGLAESPLQDGFVQMNWRSVVDGEFFPLDAETALQSGQFNHVPVLLGSNADEMALSAPPTVFPFMVQSLFNNAVPADLVADGLALYPPGMSNEEARMAYVRILTDAQFTAPARRTARWIAEQQEEPVWRYFFSHHHAGVLSSYGAYHGIELFYLFNNWENSPLALGPLFTMQDDSVQQHMLHYWTHFAGTGNPNGEALVDWPEFTGAGDCYLDIKATPDGSVCGLRTAESDYWDLVAGVVTADHDISEAPNLRCFPNPTRDYVQIEGLSTYDQAVLQVFDAHGRLLLQGQQLNRVNLGGQPSGQYLLRIILPEAVVVRWVTKR